MKLFKESSFGLMHKLMKRIANHLAKTPSSTATFPNSLVSTGDFKLWDQSDKNLSMISLSFWQSSRSQSGFSNKKSKKGKSQHSYVEWGYAVIAQNKKMGCCFIFISNFRSNETSTRHASSPGHMRYFCPEAVWGLLFDSLLPLSE